MNEVSDLEKYALGAELEKLVAEEAEARRSYYLCLTKFSHLFEEEEVLLFNEIISEELKHSDILSGIVFRLTKNSAEE